MMDSPIKKILVPVDLSQTSLNALSTGAYLAKKHQASLQFLNIIERIPGKTDKTNDLNQTNLDVLTALNGAIMHTSEIIPKMLQRTGHVVDSVVNLATTDQIDLIVLGTHGASGYREGFIGSNAYNIIKYSPCPVLTIPPRGRYQSFNKILFPIRPVAGALLRYDYACQFFSPNSTLEVLGLTNIKMEKETSVLDKIAGEIKDRPELKSVKVHTSWSKGGSVSDDILYSSLQNNADLIIMTSLLDAVNKYNFIGPHAQKIINCSKVPILSMKKLGIPMLA